MSVSGNEDLVEFNERSLEALGKEEEQAEEYGHVFGGSEEDVVYIGDKPKKTINYKGGSFTFLKLTPTPVPASVADYLLGFKEVFSTVGEMNSEIVRIQQRRQHQNLVDESRRLEEQSRQQQQEELRKTTVRIGNDEIDLAKLTSVQMRDFAEGHGIELHLLPPAPADIRIYLINHFNRKGKTA